MLVSELEKFQIAKYALMQITALAYGGIWSCGMTVKLGRPFAEMGYPDACCLLGGRVFIAITESFNDCHHRMDSSRSLLFIIFVLSMMSTNVGYMDQECFFL